jgi:hypothetical protein
MNRGVREGAYLVLYFDSVGDDPYGYNDEILEAIGRTREACRIRPEWGGASLSKGSWTLISV